MYSQNNEEKIILQYFESPAGNVKPGTLLDIGANDGQTLSNSRALILKGWAAVLVEPDPLAFERLQHLYRQVLTVECHRAAIGTVDEKVEFNCSTSHLGKGDTGLLSTAMASEMDRFPGTEFYKAEVWMYTFKNFLDKSEYKTFDFVTIDAEGMDLEILKQIDYNATKTKLVCVEWNSKNRHLYDQVMYPFGFRIVHLNGENILYGR